HPHELLDSVVKERLVKIFRLNPGVLSKAAPQLTHLNHKIFSIKSEIYVATFFKLLVSGRRIIQY
ncbi:hypothetical protein, partial [Pseudomonas sp. O11]|uniref:hypothetical protein n=1 Tax=Pseudomonas sp. O11 TaxID=3159446 RepID=UPI00387AD346